MHKTVMEATQRRWTLRRNCTEKDAESASVAEGERVREAMMSDDMDQQKLDEMKQRRTTRMGKSHESPELREPRRARMR